MTATNSTLSCLSCMSSAAACSAARRAVTQRGAVPSAFIAVFSSQSDNHSCLHTMLHVLGVENRSIMDAHPEYCHCPLCTLSVFAEGGPPPARGDRPALLCSCPTRQGNHHQQQPATMAATSSRVRAEDLNGSREDDNDEDAYHRRGARRPSPSYENRDNGDDERRPRRASPSYERGSGPPANGDRGWGDRSGNARRQTPERELDAGRQAHGGPRGGGGGYSGGGGSSRQGGNGAGQGGDYFAQWVVMPVRIS